MQESPQMRNKKSRKNFDYVSSSRKLFFPMFTNKTLFPVSDERVTKTRCYSLFSPRASSWWGWLHDDDDGGGDDTKSVGWGGHHANYHLQLIFFCAQFYNRRTRYALLLLAYLATLWTLDCHFWWWLSARSFYLHFCYFFFALVARSKIAWKSHETASIGLFCQQGMHKLIFFFDVATN